MTLCQSTSCIIVLSFYPRCCNSPPMQSRCNRSHRFDMQHSYKKLCTHPPQWSPLGLRFPLPPPPPPPLLPLPVWARPWTPLPSPLPLPIADCVSKRISQLHPPSSRNTLAGLSLSSVLPPDRTCRIPIPLARCPITSPGSRSSWTPICIPSPLDRTRESSSCSSRTIIKRYQHTLVSSSSSLGASALASLHGSAASIKSEKKPILIFRRST